MKPLIVEQPIEAPADVVWSIVTDLDASPETISGIDSLERLAGPDFGVGTRWKETRTMFGKQATEEMEVSAVDPGRSYEVRADSHSTHYHSLITVEGLGEDRSRLTMQFSAEPQGLMTRVMAETIGRAFAGATRKALAQDLSDIAAEAERRARAA